MILMDLRNRPDMRAPAQAVTVLTADEHGEQRLDTGPRRGDASTIPADRRLTALRAASRQQSDGSTTRLG
jgi:hypothetical protein